MHEIDKRIGLIRFLLADVDSRIQQREETISQYKLQITRIVEATVAHAGDVGQALTAMAEVEERLAQVEIAQRHLRQVRQRANRELEALLLTKRVADAKAQLAELEGRRQDLLTQLAALDGEDLPRATAMPAEAADDSEAAALRALNDQLSRQIDDLHRLIWEASQRAARSISAGL